MGRDEPLEKKLARIERRRAEYREWADAIAQERSNACDDVPADTIAGAMPMAVASKPAATTCGGGTSQTACMQPVAMVAHADETMVAHAQHTGGERMLLDPTGDALHDTLDTSKRMLPDEITTMVAMTGREQRARADMAADLAQAQREIIDLRAQLRAQARATAHDIADLRMLVHAQHATKKGSQQAATGRSAPEVAPTARPSGTSRPAPAVARSAKTSSAHTTSAPVEVTCASAMCCLGVGKSATSAATPDTTCSPTADGADIADTSTTWASAPMRPMAAVARAQFNMTGRDGCYRCGAKAHFVRFCPMRRKGRRKKPAMANTEEATGACAQCDSTQHRDDALPDTLGTSVDTLREPWHTIEGVRGQDDVPPKTTGALPIAGVGQADIHDAAGLGASAFFERPTSAVVQCSAKALGTATAALVAHACGGKLGDGRHALEKWQQAGHERAGQPQRDYDQRHEHPPQHERSNARGTEPYHQTARSGGRNDTNARDVRQDPPASVSVMKHADRPHGSASLTDTETDMMHKSDDPSARFQPIHLAFMF